MTKKHWIEQAFGTSNLYEILSCPKDASRSALRKAYYRAALQHHPDKNGDPQRFQAISLAYQILENAETRQEYDESGVIPGDDTLDDESTNAEGVQQWKEYFDKIFGRVTTSKIDAFAQKYKCSDEECRDVLDAFVKCRGNLVKMMDIVLVSEFRDATRWVDDFLQPAMDKGQLDRKFETAMTKSLKICQKKAQKQDEETESEEASDDDNDNEDEEKEQKPPPKKGGSKQQPSPATKQPPKKAGKTRAKKPQMDDLVAAIQNKRGGSSSSSMFAKLGERYGVNMDTDDDPLSGDKFDKVQTKMLNKNKVKTKKK